MPNLITVKISVLVNDLYIAKSYLENYDIPCFIQDENISLVYSIGSAAMGGAKLQVSEENAEKARMLLIRGGFAKPEDYI